MNPKPDTPLPIAVLGSGRGSNFVALADTIQRDRLPIRIVRVASDRSDASILQHARARNLPTYFIGASKFRTKLEPELEERLADRLQHDGARLIVLAGYMRVVKAPLLDRFPAILNIHPSLLPDFPGLRAWEQALNAGVTHTGCTVHWVTEGVDEGPILAQATVPILPQDTAESLHARIQREEHQILPKVVAQIARGEIPLPQKS